MIFINNKPLLPFEYKSCDLNTKIKKYDEYSKEGFLVKKYKKTGFNEYNQKGFLIKSEYINDFGQKVYRSFTYDYDKDIINAIENIEIYNTANVTKRYNIILFENIIKKIVIEEIYTEKYMSRNYYDEKEYEYNKKNILIKETQKNNFDKITINYKYNNDKLIEKITSSEKEVYNYSNNTISVVVYDNLNNIVKNVYYKIESDNITYMLSSNSDNSKNEEQNAYFYNDIIKNKTITKYYKFNDCYSHNKINTVENYDYDLKGNWINYECEYFDKYKNNKPYKVAIIKRDIIY